MGDTYRILDPIGHGGFGTVYRAERLGDGGFSKTVAVKILNEEASSDQEMCLRLRDEARILGRLRHRALLQTDGLVLLDGRWSVVMEYVKGVTLKRAVHSLGPLPWGVAIEIIREVAAALHVAFSTPGPDGSPLQVLHRDVKPSNIQVTSAGEVKLLDFGLATAKHIPQEHISTSEPFGSWPYLAPERLDGVNGPSGDIYGLGATLYELLAGMHLGRAMGHPDRHTTHIGEALGRLERMPGMSQPVTDLLADMLAHNPRRRPSARDIERRCLELLHKWRGGSLLDWAEEQVPYLIERETPPGDELTGSILEASGGLWARSSTPTPTRIPSPPGYAERLALLMAAGAFVSGIVCTLLAVYLLS